MVVKVNSVRSQALVKSAESLGVSVTADRGLLDPETLPLSSPPQLDSVQPAFCIWPARPKAGGRYGSEGEPVRRKEAKKRREVITSSHWVLKIPPRFITGPCTGDKRRPFGAKGAGMFWRNMTPQIPALAREARLRSLHPLLFGCNRRGVV